MSFISEEQFIINCEKLSEGLYPGIAEEVLDELDERDYSVSYIEKSSVCIAIEDGNRTVTEMIERKKAVFETLDQLVNFIIDNEIQFVSQIYYHQHFDYIEARTIREFRLVYF